MAGLDSLLGGRFGSVDKAAFMVGKKQKDDGTWDFEGPYEVLLNPSSLKVVASTQVKKDEGVANEATPETASNDGKITPKGVAEQQVDMTLTFNIVEAYNAKTKGVEFKALVTAATSVVSSLIGGGSVGDSAEEALTDLVNKTDFTNLSLFNKELCCYEYLRQAAHKQVPVVFYWGNLMYSGIIVKFQTVFNYFSNQGAPLGAEVALSLVAAMNDEGEKLSPSTQKLLGLVKEGGRLIRQLPGT